MIWYPLLEADAWSLNVAKDEDLPVSGFALSFTGLMQAGALTDFRKNTMPLTPEQTPVCDPTGHRAKQE